MRRLRSNAAALREGLRAEGLNVGGDETQIVPVIVGEADAAMELSERLLERGVFAQAIRPPTVPAGTCRLRLTAMATHRIGDLRKAARLIGRTARELGLRGEGEAERRPRHRRLLRRSPTSRAAVDARHLRHRDRHRGR